MTRRRKGSTATLHSVDADRMSVRKWFEYRVALKRYCMGVGIVDTVRCAVGANSTTSRCTPPVDGQEDDIRAYVSPEVEHLSRWHLNVLWAEPNDGVAIAAATYSSAYSDHTDVGAMDFAWLSVESYRSPLACDADHDLP